MESFGLSFPIFVLQPSELHLPCNGLSVDLQSLCFSWFQSTFSLVTQAEHTHRGRSPNYLPLKGRTEAAHSLLARIYGKHNHVDAWLAHLKSKIQQEMNPGKKPSYLNYFKGTDRKRTFTVCLLQLGNSLIGSALLTQNIYFLTQGGLPAIHAFDINIGGFCLALLIMTFSWYSETRSDDARCISAALSGISSLWE